MRITAGLIAVLVAAAALVGVGAAPAQACTCGALIGDGGTVPSPSTRAIVSWADGVETIEIAASARGAEGSVGLIVPTPARAQVEAGDPALFARLDRAIRPTETVEDDWWGRAGDPEPVEAAEPAPATIDAQRVRAGDLAGVTSWAKKQGFELDDTTARALDAYERNGWSLSLVTLSASTLDGELAPVRLTFSSKLRVYPLLLASATGDPVSLRLYLPGDHRSALVQHTRAALPLDAAQAVVWSGPTAGGSAASLGTYLTVLDLRLDSPPDQVGSDLRIVDAATDDVYLPHRLVVRPITLLGLPLGWLLLGWGALGLVIGVGALVFRLRAR
jgi:hypothetical protein